MARCATASTLSQRAAAALRATAPRLSCAAGILPVVSERQLSGGVDNAGAVVRSGGHVLRPAGPQTPAVHALLAHLHATGFRGAPEPLRVDADGRERLVFIVGDVPHSPFPSWSQSTRALASTAALLRRYHDAVKSFVSPRDACWSPELADPDGGSLICHNDVCPENVVYRGGCRVRAAGLRLRGSWSPDLRSREPGQDVRPDRRPA